MQKLKGRVAIVTGVSRRQGIGTAVCRALAMEGANIFYTHWQDYDRLQEYGAEEDWPDQLQAELHRIGVQSDHGPIDLSTVNIQAMLDKVEETLGTPSILVNNACYDMKDGFRKLDGRLLDAHYDVNLKTTLLLSVEFAKRFEVNFPKGKQGSIINLISSGPLIESLAYIATKGAITAVTEPLSAALAPLGITVNSINPGPTDTGWMSDETKAYLLTQFPMGRLGLPEDAARLVVFLASEEARWITGQIIKSEGGFLRG